jgi:hypothetical protein
LNEKTPSKPRWNDASWQLAVSTANVSVYSLFFEAVFIPFTFSNGEYADTV